MRKKRKSTTNTYASYKIRKRKKDATLLILCIGVSILAVTFFSGRFEADLSAFLWENGIYIKDFHQQEHIDPIFLGQDKIRYDLYTVPEQTKGIYIPSKKIPEIREYIELAKQTQVNTFVIDVKDDQGNLTFTGDSGLVDEAVLAQMTPSIKEIDQAMKMISEAGIYPIARIVVFKDNIYTKVYPESAIKDPEGKSYVTRAGDRWLNPYDKENWEYIRSICEEACRHGFKEIQFDYIRFHESMNEQTIQLETNESKKEIITAFIKYITEALHERKVKVSADVLGTVMLSDLDASIVGQDFVKMSEYLDFISPMIYPSHYAQGSFGIEHPHLEPYEMIRKTLVFGQKRTIGNENKKAVLRPWLQDFTLAGDKPYLKYGPEEIREQINGAEQAGVNNWLFWNAAGNYTVEGLRAQ